MKFTVRVEYDVTSTEAVDVEVEASTPEEARRLALDMALGGLIEESDYYAIGDLEYSIANNADYWEVEPAI